MDIATHLKALDLDPKTFAEGDLVARSPIDGSTTARLAADGADRVDAAIGRAHAAFLAWRTVPAPRRGELDARQSILLRRLTWSRRNLGAEGNGVLRRTCIPSGHAMGRRDHGTHDSRCHPNVNA